MQNKAKKWRNPVIVLGICTALLGGCGETDTKENEPLKTETAREQENAEENMTDAAAKKDDAGSGAEEEKEADAPNDSVKKGETNDSMAEETAADENTDENTEAKTPVTEESKEGAEASGTNPEAEVPKMDPQSESTQTDPKPQKTADAAAEPEEIPQEEGMLSKPSHKKNTTGIKLVFIGDSRTEGIRDAVSDDSTWCCESGKGYEWMSSTAVPSIENQIGENTAVIILMGVNDVHQVTNYVNYINVKANEWAELGAKTYYVAVGPVEADPYVTNTQIERFNALMEANLIGVNYIDLYSHLVSAGYSTVDGTHYPNSVSVEIYNYILDNLEEPTEGIWG